MLLSNWNWAKQRKKDKKDLSGSVSTLAVGSSNMEGWEPGTACWERMCKVLLNLCIYMNSEMVIFKVSL